MEPAPIVTREEVVGIFFVINDISANVDRIVKLLQEDGDGEEEEEDAP